MKTKSVQDGVLFYLNESGDVVDIDVNAGIKSVVIDDDVSMLESNKSFPDVEQLVINDNVGKIRIWNKLFPNIKNIDSHSSDFASGEYLVEYTYAMNMKLLNVFFHDEDEEIDMTGISCIDEFAFHGCKSTKIVNTSNITNRNYIDSNAFTGSAFEEQPFVHGVKMAGLIVIDVDETADRIIIPDTRWQPVIFLNTVKLYNIKELVIHNPETMKKIGYDNGLPSSLVLETSQLVESDEDIEWLAHLHLSQSRVNHFSLIHPAYKEIDGVIYTKDMRSVVGPVRIRSYAFTYCDVESVILPDSISRIESHAFYGCRKLKDITFGNSLNYIGNSAFEDCINLKRVALPQSVRTIDSNAFLRAGLEEITLNQGLKKILTGAFYGTNIKKLEIPGSVKRFAPGNISLQLKEVVLSEFSEEVTANLVNVSTKSVNRDTILRLQCGERYVYLPRSIKGSMRNEFNNRLKCFFNDKDMEPCMLWEYAYTAKTKEDLALSEYLRCGAEEEKKYVKKNSKKIALRFIQEGNEEQLVKLLKTGLVSKVTLKVLLKELKEMPVAQAYILDQIGPNTKQTFCI
mgnify:CR=1 FL=1